MNKEFFLEHSLGFYRHQDTYVADVKVTNENIETKGYSPDIWLDTNEPLQEITKIIER